MLANLTINAKEFGANWLLKEYQNADIPFLRYPMHTVLGVTRTTSLSPKSLRDDRDDLSNLKGPSSSFDRELHDWGNRRGGACFI
jgi:hypothetical protein